MVRSLSLLLLLIQQPQSIRIDVDVVLVTASVTNDSGGYVTNLATADFSIFEDSIEQTITQVSRGNVPVSVGVVFDTSGSMKSKLSAARDAVALFFRMGTSDDEYFLVEFNNRASVTGEFTSNVAQIQNQLIFRPAEGSTALLDAMYLALTKLKETDNPRKALLLITDGEDNHSRYGLSDVKEFVKESDVQIFAIGLLENGPTPMPLRVTGRQLIAELVQMTGGQAFFPSTLNELQASCARISIELKSQYVIAYKPSNTEGDGKWRKVQVKLNTRAGSPHLNVRARSGYYAPVLTPAR